MKCLLTIYVNKLDRHLFEPIEIYQQVWIKLLKFPIFKSVLLPLKSEVLGETSMDKIWQSVTNQMRERLGELSFEAWIAPLGFIGIEGGTAKLKAPNKFFRDCVNGRYLDELRQCLSDQTGTNMEIALEAAWPDHNAAASWESMPPCSANCLANPTPVPHCELDPRLTFENFVIGSSNSLAHGAAKAVANRPGEKYNPLFLHGAVGLGKTHLATAIGHHLLSANPGCNVVFTPAELFVNELISSLRDDRMSEFKNRMRGVDVLILDDVHFLAGRERAQEEFFHTFNSLHAERHQVVLTSDKAPHELTGLEQRLRNRFESGLIAEIHPPDLETRAAILQKKASAENLHLTPEVAQFVATSVSCSVRELEGCFNRLAASASLNKGAITLDSARESLRDLLHASRLKPDIGAIQQHVCEVFHVRRVDLMSKSRSQHVAFCRQVAMYLSRRLTASSFPAIGAGFGRDHSTVIHAYNLIAGRVSRDAAFRGLIQKIEVQLKSSPVSGRSMST